MDEDGFVFHGATVNARLVKLAVLFWKIGVACRPGLRLDARQVGLDILDKLFVEPFVLKILVFEFELLLQVLIPKFE